MCVCVCVCVCVCLCEKGARETTTTTTKGQLCKGLLQRATTAPLSCAGVDNPWTTAQEGSYQTLSTEEDEAAEEEAEAEEAEAK